MLSDMLHDRVRYGSAKDCRSRRQAMTRTPVPARTWAHDEDRARQISSRVARAATPPRALGVARHSLRNSQAGVHCSVRCRDPRERRQRETSRVASRRHALLGDDQHRGYRSGVARRSSTNAEHRPIDPGGQRSNADLSGWTRRRWANSRKFESIRGST